MSDAENDNTQVTSTQEVRSAAHLNIQYQAEIHTSFHCFMEIGQIFRNKKYILWFKFILGLNFISPLGGASDGTVVRALASHQCGPGSNPGVDAICGLSLLLVLSLAPSGFSPGTPVFPSPQKPTFPNSNSTRNQVDEEPLCGCATCKSLFIFICYLFYNHTLPYPKTNTTIYIYLLKEYFARETYVNFVDFCCLRIIQNEINPFAPKPPKSPVQIHILSTACDMISSNGEGQLCLPTCAE